MSFPSRECALEIVKNSFHKSDIKPAEPSDYLKDLVQLLLISETGKLQLKSMQQYLKTHNIFVDLHNMPATESLKNLGVVANFCLDTVDTFSVKFYFCPLPDDLSDYYYHYYELVTRGELVTTADMEVPDRKISPEKKPEDFEYICYSLWDSNISASSIYETYPDVFNSLYEEYYNSELRFLPAGSGTTACKEEQNFILNNNINLLNFFRRGNKIKVVGLIPRDEFLGLDLDSLERSHMFDDKTFRPISDASKEYRNWVSEQQSGFKFSDFLNTLVAN
jgi:hypothetical protein